MPKLNTSHENAVVGRLADNLKRLRTEQGASVEAIAAAAGVAAITLRKVEARKRWPSPAVLERLAAALGVTPADLLT